MNFKIEDRGNGIKWVRTNNWDSTMNMTTLSNWCRETGCGKQVSITAISFKNEQELTMFLLKWQG